jgi:hypothetical protein
VHPLLAHPIFAMGLPHGSEWMLVLVILFFLMLPVTCSLVALISCIKHESPSDNTRLIWVLVILFVHIFGGMAYLLIRRPQRIKELGH